MTPRVPFIDLSRLVRLVARDAHADFAEVLDACELVGGPRVARLERVIAAQLGLPHAVACASGSQALVVALQTLGVGPGSLVAMPNLTFFATYEAIAQLGARAVLIDIDPDDLQLSFDAFRRAHEEHRFGAAILVHLFGWASARLADFRAFCAEREIALVEDAAQAYGVRAFGEPVLAGATMATMSFYPAKVIGGAMDGGAVLMRSPEHERVVRSLCNHGRVAHYRHERIGWSSRMGGLQAAYLLRVCAKAEEIVANRRQAATWYRELLADARGVRMYGAPVGVEENGYLCVVTSERADGETLARRLAERGIGCARTYPETIAEQPGARGAIVVGGMRESRGFCGGVVNLPMFYGIAYGECQASARAVSGAL